MTIASALRGCCLLVLSLLATGCDSGGLKTYKIPGKLVYEDNTPVPGASLIFQTTVDGEVISAQGMVNPDGSFKLTTFKPDDGVLAGEHTVSVAPLPPGDGEARPQPPVPQIYWDLKTSGLKGKIEPTTKEIVLTINRQNAK
ncbi:MAG TPA: hypothetical protein VL096_02570 [Pirellulaceae bacterium]|nr:hypothetical protein [Pirellulaceae bacterium]